MTNLPFIVVQMTCFQYKNVGEIITSYDAFETLYIFVKDLIFCCFDLALKKGEEKC